MIKLQLRIEHLGNPHVVFDYIMPSFAKKFKHFANAAGLQDQYSKGKISAHDCINKQVFVSIGIEKERTYTDVNTGQQKTAPKKNFVKEYLMRDFGGPVGFIDLKTMV